MPGYSGTPLARKLGVKEGSTVVLFGAPPGFEADLEPLPDGADVRRDPVDQPAPCPNGGFDVALLFVTRRADLERRFPQAAAQLQPAGGLWVAWPKKASKVPTDLTEDVLREVVLPLGWVDNKVCAVTDVWSGLRFVLRLENRPARPRKEPPRRP